MLRILFAKNANYSSTWWRALVPDVNSSVKINLTEQTSSHLSYAFTSTCYHEDIQTYTAAHPEGQVIWYPWSKRWGGGWALLNNGHSMFWRSPEAFPPLLFVTKTTSFATDSLIFKRNICTDVRARADTNVLRGQRGSGLVLKKWDERGLVDISPGHQEVWMALMKDGER